jgi:hypothetical protein
MLVQCSRIVQTFALIEHGLAQDSEFRLFRIAQLPLAFGEPRSRETPYLPALLRLMGSCCAQLVDSAAQLHEVRNGAHENEDEGGTHNSLRNLAAAHLKVGMKASCKRDSTPN